MIGYTRRYTGASGGSGPTAYEGTTRRAGSAASTGFFHASHATPRPRGGYNATSTSSATRGASATGCRTQRPPHGSTRLARTFYGSTHCKGATTKPGTPKTAAARTTGPSVGAGSRGRTSSWTGLWARTGGWSRWTWTPGRSCPGRTTGSGRSTGRRRRRPSRWRKDGSGSRCGRRGRGSFGWSRSKARGLQRGTANGGRGLGQAKGGWRSGKRPRTSSGTLSATTGWASRGTTTALRSYRPASGATANTPRTRTTSGAEGRWRSFGTRSTLSRRCGTGSGCSRCPAA